MLAGANKEARDKKEKTPADYAKDAGHRQIWMFLKSYDASEWWWW